MMNNTNYEKTVAGVLLRDGQVLLARHTYGAGKNMLIIPGGYIEQGESPEAAVIREYREETGVTIAPTGIIGIRFNMHDWYVVFKVAYISGTPRNDGNENSEVVWMSVEEALARDDVAELTKSLIRAAVRGQAMSEQDYTPTSDQWSPQSFYLCGRSQPTDRKDELIAHLQYAGCLVHEEPITGIEPGRHYGTSLIATHPENPNKHLRLDLQSDGEITACFEYWHSHFDSSAWSYAMLYHQLCGLLENRFCSLSLHDATTGQWRAAKLLEDTESPDGTKNFLSDITPHIRNIQNKSVELRYRFWDESRDRSELITI